MTNSGTNHGLSVSSRLRGSILRLHRPVSGTTIQPTASTMPPLSSVRNNGTGERWGLTTCSVGTEREVDRLPFLV